MSYYHNYKRGLYRSRHGVLLGICQGMSEYFNLPVFWIRVTLVILFLISGFFPVVLLYILAGLIMKKNPDRSSEHSWCNNRCDHYNDRHSEKLRERLDQLRRKMKDTESNMSYREYRWDRKFSE